MKLKNTITAVVMIFSLGVGVLSAGSAEAAGANNKAGKAFADALSDGKIAYGKSATYSIGDMDGDGVKDLLVNSKSAARVYAYKSGQVKVILKYIPEYSLGYDAGKKVFWETGEGDGGWHIAHQLKNGSLVETYRYFSEYGANDSLKYYYQKAGGAKKEITAEQYRKVGKRAGKSEKKSSKAKLIDKLNDLQ